MNRYETIAARRILDVIAQTTMSMDRWNALVSVVACLVTEEVACVANRAQVDMISMELRHGEEIEILKSRLQDDRTMDPCTVTIHSNNSHS